MGQSKATMSEPLIELRWRRAEGLSLAEALEAGASLLTAGGPALALILTPRRCHLARLERGRPVAPGLDGGELDSAFEARAFGSAGELRWVHTGGELGIAHLLGERQLPRLGEGDEEGVVRALRRLPSRYLLWGQRAEEEVVPAGWVRWREARVRGLLLPAEVAPASGRAWLHGREYVGTLSGKPPADDDEGDGALLVVEELLVGIGGEHLPGGMT